MTKGTANVTSAFVAEVSGLIPWEYADPHSSLTNLYELAKQKAWNAAKDIPWESEYRRDSYPIRIENNPLVAFAPYESLSEEEKIRATWLLHGLEVSEILHGEQGALIIASQLVSCMPSVEAKLFAGSQVFDEARHVEFFSRYLREIVGSISAPSSPLRTLIEQTLVDSRWDMKFIACQLVIESLAMAKFQELKQKTTVPLLEFAIDYITKDEARHVRFGTETLRTFAMSLDRAALEERSEFVLNTVIRLAESDNIYTRLAEGFGWELRDLLFHLRKYRVTHPEINRNRFRQLTMNLSAVGLLTDKTKNRLQNMNLLC